MSGLAISLFLMVALLFIGWRTRFFNLLKPEDLEILGADEADLAREKTISKTFYLVTVFLLIQIQVINILVPGRDLIKNTKIGGILSFPFLINLIIFCLNLILLFLIRHLIKLMGRERETIIRRIKEKNSLRLDWEKEARLHDRNHHLGMLYMLLQTGYTDRAREYLKGMVGELQNIDAIVRTGNEALNALIRGKMSRAKQLGVQINIDVLKGLYPMNIQDWELNRIIGNLLDNAIEAVENLNGEKNIELLIEGGEGNNRFEVITHGVYLPDEVETRIFQRGYSSKTEPGHGLGLAICKELVEIYKGAIFIEKDEEKNYTSFRVLLPAAKTGS